MSGLFGSQVLDTAIGLVFVYLLVALIAMVINEWIAQLTQLRARTLQDGLRNMLNDPKSARDIAAEILNHPLISGISPIDKRVPNRPIIATNSLPNYIPPREFALALLDVVAPRGGASRSVQSIRASVITIQNESVRTTLLALIEDANNDIVALRTGVESWFNNAMQRVSGWYQRKMRYISLIVALVLALAMNADTAHIAESLWSGPVLRSSVAAAASTYASNAATQTGNAPSGFTNQERGVEDSLVQLAGTTLPLFWSTQPGDPRGLPGSFVAWLIKIAGLGLTTLAVTLGAPFWFDVLNQFMRFRAGGDAPSAVPA